MSGSVLPISTHLSEKHRSSVPPPFSFSLEVQSTAGCLISFCFCVCVFVCAWCVLGLPKTQCHLLPVPVHLLMPLCQLHWWCPLASNTMLIWPVFTQSVRGWHLGSNLHNYTQPWAVGILIDDWGHVFFPPRMSRRLITASAVMWEEMCSNWFVLGFQAICDQEEGDKWW